MRRDAHRIAVALLFRSVQGPSAAAHNGPGTTILAKPGVYRETMTVPSSGSSAGAFIYRAFSPGVVVP